MYLFVVFNVVCTLKLEVLRSTVDVMPSRVACALALLEIYKRLMIIENEYTEESNICNSIRYLQHQHQSDTTCNRSQ